MFIYNFVCLSNCRLGYICANIRRLCVNKDIVLGRAAAVCLEATIRVPLGHFLKKKKVC